MFDPPPWRRCPGAKLERLSASTPHPLAKWPFGVPIQNLQSAHAFRGWGWGPWCYSECLAVLLHPQLGVKKWNQQEELCYLASLVSFCILRGGRKRGVNLFWNFDQHLRSTEKCHETSGNTKTVKAQNVFLGERKMKKKEKRKNKSTGAVQKSYSQYCQGGAPTMGGRLPQHDSHKEGSTRFLGLGYFTPPEAFMGPTHSSSWKCSHSSEET